MSTTIHNYDGSIVSTPQQLVRPETVAEIQAILTKPDRYPGPVRPMGSFHSLTPCVATSGTVVDMTGLKEHVVSAYGERWKRLSDWVRTVDPAGRMINPFFQELMS